MMKLLSTALLMLPPMSIRAVSVDMRLSQQRSTSDLEIEKAKIEMQRHMAEEIQVQLTSILEKLTRGSDDIADLSAPISVPEDLSNIEDSVIKMIKHQIPRALVPIMNTIVGLVGNMQTVIESMAPSTQASMDALNDTFSDCDCLKSRNDTMTLAQQHLRCRIQQATISQNVSSTCEECSILKTLIPSAVPSVCDKSSSDTSTLGQAQRVRDFFQQQIQAWQALNASCYGTNASCGKVTGSLADQNATCNALQTNLDALSCKVYDSYCHLYYTCIQKARATFVAANATIAAAANSRFLQWQAADRIKCYLNCLQTGCDQAALTAAMNSCQQSSSPPDVSIRYLYYMDREPRMPNGTDCSFLQPGTPMYVQQMYQALPSTAPAATCTASCCSTCKYYNCTGSARLKPGAANLSGFSEAECCLNCPCSANVCISGFVPKAQPTTTNGCGITECCNPVNWSYPAWPNPNCSDECGLDAVTQNRTVQCTDTITGLVVPNSKCATVSPPTSRVACAPTASCGNCSGFGCGVGSIVRQSSVKCKLASGCTTDDCCAPVSWVYPAWNNNFTCNATCGLPVTFATRTVQCQDIQTRLVVDDSLCVGQKPNARKMMCPATGPCSYCSSYSCPSGTASRDAGVMCQNASGCTTGECCSIVNWSYPAWDNTTCSSSCGLPGVVQVRNMQCIDTNSKQVVSDSLCPSPKPDTNRTKCPATPPCPTCSKNFTCPSRGYVARTNAGGCDSAAGCTAKDCCSPTQWFNPAWPNATCNSSCGQAQVIQVRPVACLNSENLAVVNDQVCDGVKPVSSHIECPPTRPCQSCSSYQCPLGMVSKNITAFCQAAACTPRECCDEVYWSYARWDNVSCSTSCGQAAVMQTRPVTCIDLMTGSIFPDSYCSGMKPATSRTACQATPACPTCADFSCPVGFIAKAKCSACPSAGCTQALCCSQVGWKFAAWDNFTCSSACGQSPVIQNRSVTCVQTDTQAVVANTACAGSKPPATRLACSSTPACPDCSRYICPLSSARRPGASSCGLGGCNSSSCCIATKWTYPDWEVRSCSTQCGSAAVIQTRIVQCVNAETGASLPDNLCTSTKPAISRQACPATESCDSIVSCTPSSCPAGWVLKSNNLTCQGSSGCTTSYCCSPTNWAYPDWEAVSCSDQCGQATVLQTRVVECVNADTAITVTANLCSGTKPATSRIACGATDICPPNPVCASVQCPRGSVVKSGSVVDVSQCCSQTSWSYVEWDNITCTSQCNQPQVVQSRSVQCIEVESGAVVPDGQCAGTKPASLRVKCPATPTCQDSCSSYTCPLGAIPKQQKSACDAIAGCNVRFCCDGTHWSYAEWGFPKCSTTCGSPAIYETRAVECVNVTTAQVVPDSFCTDPKPATTQIKCPATDECPGSCSDFICPNGWLLNPSSSCDPVFGCTSSLCCFQTLCSDYSCPSGWMPKDPITLPKNCASPLACTSTECCILPQWSYQNWPSPVCSTNCSIEPLFQTRSVSCQDTITGQVLADGSCTGLKPATSRTVCLENSACPTCSGFQCDLGWASLSNNTCASSRGCTAHECCTRVHWVYTNWLPPQCSTTCGNSALWEARTVTCQDTNGNTYPDSVCPKPKPDTTRVACAATQPCNVCSDFICSPGTTPKGAALSPSSCASSIACTAGECCEPIGWVTSSWPTVPCNNSCGQKTVKVYRNATCESASGIRVPDENCLGQKPVNNWIACNASVDCPFCSQFQCPLGFASSPPDETPALCTSSGGCTLQECCQPVGWVFAKWQTANCDSTCGLPPLISTRDVTCETASGVIIPDSYCIGPKPATSHVDCLATPPSCSTFQCGAGWSPKSAQQRPQCCANISTCAVTECCEPVSWVYPSWTSVVCECGRPPVTENRNVLCQTASGKTVADSSCPVPKPPTSQVSCLNTSCPADTCSRFNCGIGMVNSRVPKSCSPVFGCTANDCCTVASWVYPDWVSHQCDSTCGLPAITESRNVQCKTSVGEVVSDSNCNRTKPDASRVACPAVQCSPCTSITCPAGTNARVGALCQNATCTANECCNAVNWSYPDWDNGTCNTSCGLPAISQLRTVQCIDTTSKLVVSDSLCLSPKPNTTRARCPAIPPCLSCSNNFTCPSKGYTARIQPAICDSVTGCTLKDCCSPTQWFIPDWPNATCNTSCGQPQVVQVRKLACLNSQNLAAVDDFKCDGGKPPSSHIECPSTPPCQSCSSYLCPLGSISKNSTSFCQAASCMQSECCDEVRWSNSLWDNISCSTGCGQAAVIQTRLVTCIKLLTGSTLPDVYCSGPKPDTNRTACQATPVCPTCANFSCPVGFVSKAGNTLCPSAPGCTQTSCCNEVRWNYVDWDNSTCSSLCGQPAVMQNRNVTCVQSDTQAIVADAACVGTKPPATRTKCPATAACSDCSSYTCSAGSVQRPGVSKCDGAGGCNNSFCCAATNWTYAIWEARNCSLQCGQSSVIQTRIVQCVNGETGAAVSDSLCIHAKPATSIVVCPATKPCEAITSCTSGNCPSGWVLKSGNLTCQGSSGCNTSYCCDQTNWAPPEWEVLNCSKQCGQAAISQSRVVKCVNNKTAITVPDNLCSGTKPATSRVACSATAICPPQPMCSSVRCPVGSVVKASSANCSNVTCNVSQCCNPTNWSYIDWDDYTCSTACNLRPVVQRRIVICVEVQSGAIVPDGLCTGTKPASSRVKCPATPACGRPCSSYTCSAGSVPKQQNLTCDLIVACNNSFCCDKTNWSYSAWVQPTCPTTCGSPRVDETRTVQCVNNATGQVFADSLCTDPKPATSRVKCNATAACGSCSDFTCRSGWLLNPSGSCNAVSGCNSSVCCFQVLCSNYTCPTSWIPKDGSAVPATCTSSAGCTARECCLMPQWTYQNWPSPVCSTNCSVGPSVQTRNVTCQDAVTGQVLADRLCTAGKPATSRTVCLNTASCPTCAGFQCDLGWAGVDAKTCTNSSGCTAYECCTRVQWVYNSWSPPKCSTACNTSALWEARTVTCQDSKGTRYPDSVCTQPKPETMRVACAATQPCNVCSDFICNPGTTPKSAASSPSSCASSVACTVGECCEPIGWVTSAWPNAACDDSCGQKTVKVYRNVTCESASGTRVPDESCMGQKPGNGRIACTASPDCTFCSQFQCPLGFASLSSDQTPPVCKSSDGCTLVECCQPVGWVFPTWNATSCDKTCALPPLMSNRDVACQAASGVIVPDSYCTGPKPATVRVDCPATPPSCSTFQCAVGWSPKATQQLPQCCANVSSCTVSECCDPVSWAYPNWTDPVCECGRPPVTEHRNVVCQTASGRTVADSSCPTPKPPTSRVNCLDSKPCPTLTCSGFNCSIGFVNRPLKTCSLDIGCTARDCCIAASWVYPAWAISQCNASCGLPAVTESRVVQCMTSAGEVVSDSNCTGSKPDTSRVACPAVTCSCAAVTCKPGSIAKTCSPSQCKSSICTSAECCDATSWVYRPWQTPKCKTSCGTPAGNESRSVTCQNLVTGAQLPENACLEPKPSTRRVCEATTSCCADFECSPGWSKKPSNSLPMTCGSGGCKTNECCKKVDDGPCRSVGSGACTNFQCSSGWVAKPTSDSPATCFSALGCTTLECCDRASWVAGDWPDDCSQTCGQAEVIQTRTLTCQAPCGKVLPNCRCQTPAPATQRICPATELCSGIQDCSSFQCGVGWAPKSCAATPTICTNGCSQQQCCFRVSWVHKQWIAPKCDSCCGLDPVTETRQVVCQGPLGTIVADARCPQPKPDVFRVTCPATALCPLSGPCSTFRCSAGWILKNRDFFPSNCNSPFGCTALECCDTVSWTYQQWSTPDCDSSCGLAAVTETRPVRCQRADGTLVADSYCSSTKPEQFRVKCAATQPCAVPVLCLSFKCGAGWALKDPQDFPSICTNPNSCSNAECCRRVSWVYTDWTNSVCPPGCGQKAITETRLVTCQASDGTVVPDQLCPSAKPATSRVKCLDTPPCTACANYKCGLGWVTKSSSDLPDQCSNPSACSATECCQRVSWVYVDWADTICDQSCGQQSLYETRLVTCQTSDGSIVSDQRCATAKPASSRLKCPATTACYPACDNYKCSSGWTQKSPSEFPTNCQSRQGCSPAECCRRLSWVYVDWMPAVCEHICGQPATTESRVVTCQSSDGTVVSDQLCSGMKPATSRTKCPATPTCASCSTYSCGLGWVAKSAQDLPESCQDTSGCSPRECCRRVSWVYVDWTEAVCDQSCGNAAVTESRVVTCQSSDGTVVDDALCSGSMPSRSRVKCPATEPCSSSSSSCVSYQCRSGWALKQTSDMPNSCYTPGECSLVECCRRVSWVYVDWTTPQCSLQCGLPAVTETRVVTCQSSDGSVVDDSICSGTKPQTTRTKCPATQPCSSSSISV